MGQWVVKALGSDERIPGGALRLHQLQDICLYSKITPVAVPYLISRSAQLLQLQINSLTTHRDPNAPSTHNGGRIRATKAQQQRQAGAARRGCRWKGAMLR
jgi:hypothetical protein